MHLSGTESIIVQNKKKSYYFSFISNPFLLDILYVFADSFLIKSFPWLALTPHWFISSFHHIILSRGKEKKRKDLFRQAYRVKNTEVNKGVRKDGTSGGRKGKEGEGNKCMIKNTCSIEYRKCTFNNFLVSGLYTKCRSKISRFIISFN